MRLLYFTLDNYFFYSASIFQFRFIMLLSYLYFCLKFVFTLIKLLKRREIFVISNKLCVFFNPYISSHTFKVGICYIYIYVYVRHASRMDFERAGVQTLEKGQTNIKRKKMDISHILVISF